MEINLPWYDSPWLATYKKVKDFIAEHYPERLSEFEGKLSVFRTNPEFNVVTVGNLLSEEKLCEIKEHIKSIKMNDYEKQEFFNFGRLIMHDLPYFKQLQHELTQIVSENVGEEVEPCYNFLSLYNNFGVCAIHMDAPQAKWTLDICIDQSAPWPIHFSQIVPWPENFDYTGNDWEDHIKKDPKHRFTSFTLEPGDSLLFSGSSQWHYRERIVRTTKDNFCHLLFLHYVPKGTLALSKPKNWAQIFGIPQLDEVVPQKQGSSRLYALNELLGS
ncbi:hypothetical protein [Spirosoma rigui]|uniref:hypothetical protein n=1 Tax=Spirosoma rigui TaxID=564064 RepID=UPI0009B0710B|nr:hypothetical protein [Spirosoma rigui]